MKSVRTREEALDDLRRKRRRVGVAADSAEKKLSKMSPEHKNLASQTEALNRLREDMRTMDGDIVREETELGDFKRRCAKSWMQAKFGGLAECCEKGLVSHFALFAYRPSHFHTDYWRHRQSHRCSTSWQYVHMYHYDLLL